MEEEEKKKEEERTLRRPTVFLHQNSDQHVSEKKPPEPGEKTA